MIKDRARCDGKRVEGRSAAFACPLALSVAFASLLTSYASVAQERNSATAEALFRDARSLMAAGNTEAACAKFGESNRIDPKIGTLMNLALCHEKSGRNASAWSEYIRAASLAARAGQPDREKVANERAAALEPGLSHVTIDADPKANATVTLDDESIGPAAYRTAIPVDPGAHVLRATAPGAAPYEQSFRVTPGAPTRMLSVPALEPVAAPVPEAPAPAAPEPAPLPAAPAPSTDLRNAGLVVGAAGLVLWGVGGYFGAHAFAEKSTADSECGAIYCTQAGLDAIHAMKTAEATSTLTLVAGTAAVGAGVWLVVFRSKRGDHHPSAQSATTVGLSPDFGRRGIKMVITW